MNNEFDRNLKPLNQSENYPYAINECFEVINAPVAKKTICTRLRNYLNNIIHQPHLFIKVFSYISVLILGCLTCYLIVQSFKYGFFQSSKSMLVGPRSTIVRVNYNCLLDYLTTPYQKDVFFSNGRRKPKKKSLFKKKCNKYS
jgi:hypothetical protein